MTSSPKLIRCSAEPPWSCAFECRTCGTTATVAGPHPGTNHAAISKEAAAHDCREA